MNFTYCKKCASPISSKYNFDLPKYCIECYRERKALLKDYNETLKKLRSIMIYLGKDKIMLGKDLKMKGFTKSTRKKIYNDIREYFN